MPNFDLRGIKIGEYKNASGTVTYGAAQSIGDAMSCNLELRYAEGRLYAESKLAEFMRQATGGSISIAVKYIPAAAQTLMYGSKGNSDGGVKFSTADESKYVGVAFYAPDMIDSVQAYTCVFVRKALFAPPSMSFQTKGENITFQTPTTSGEFLADDSADTLLLETAVCDTAEAAKTWVDGKFGS